ncbi:MAG TPA: ABC transporter permease [Candidatus Saccharimonadales bacterium]
MMRFRDSATLALTKLRTRKIRLVITLVISSLLFTALIAGSLVFRGAFASFESFNKEGFGNRYIVQGNDNSSGVNVYSDEKIIERAKEIHKDIVARKKAEAKKLEIPYDPIADNGPVMEFDAPGGKQQALNLQSPAGQQAVQEFYQKNPPIKTGLFKKSAEPYHPTAFYRSKVGGYGNDGSWQVLKGGKEKFDSSMGSGKEMYTNSKGTESFLGSWKLMDSNLLQPFTLPDQNLKRGADSSIPVIIPFSASEELLGLKGLPSTASSQQKLERVKEVRQKAGALSFSVCYRNATSTELINAAIATQQEIDRNKKNKDYVKPSLIYGLPDKTCGSSPIIRDIRNADQKKLDAKQKQFDELFGKKPAQQETLTFRVVGLVPDIVMQGAAGVNQILGSLMGSTLGYGWFTPLDVGEQHPVIKSHFDEINAFMSGGRASEYVEFRTAADAKEFISKTSCEPEFKDPENTPDPYIECEKLGQIFSPAPFGSNSLAMESIKGDFGKFFALAALVVAAIGSIIMMGTVGRMITDSRRETAVFRAIGAKRMDIAQIYIFYTLTISVLISICALVGGSIAALIVQNKYADQLTLQALVAYNAQDLDKTFSLFRLYLPDMILMAGLAIAVSLISISIPLLRNLRRNPIRDMRDEN